MSAPVTRPAVRLIARLMERFLMRVTVSGRQNLPSGGPLLLAFNHLGHFDAPLLIATLPWDVEALALSDLLRVPVTGQMCRLYGVIPVHRDAFDRAVLDRALDILGNGGVLALAPEARQSLTGALEKARHGAAYLALKTRAPILPVALTGTENAVFYGAWKAHRRPLVTITIGPLFHLPYLSLDGPQRRQSVEDASTLIMTRLAALLPAAYRGVYAGMAQRP